MYEKVLQERAKTDEFVARNEQVWSNGFVASEAMYLLALDAASDVNAYLSELSKEQLSEKMFRYYVLRELHGRACQQYLEILHLLKGGFSDGAFARWRSLYELSVIAEFIRNNDEEVAKAYHSLSFTDDSQHNWAKAAPCFSGRKRVTFSDIQQKCSLTNDAWNSQYRLANKVVHASPQGTFGRLGVAPTSQVFIPVGRSDYGLAAPAINAAISLSMISTSYFSMVASGDALVYMKTLKKWVDVVRKYYTDIEENCFSSENDIK